MAPQLGCLCMASESQKKISEHYNTEMQVQVYIQLQLYLEVTHRNISPRWVYWPAKNVGVDIQNFCQNFGKVPKKLVGPSVQLVYKIHILYL